MQEERERERERARDREGEREKVHRVPMGHCARRTLESTLMSPDEKETEGIL
jgi:hypothetical protein